jgi:hypothetical protein
LGAGRDFAMINVDATAKMSGIYKGGANEDYLTLVEGVVSDNGASVDFGASIPGDPNSAIITNFGGGASEVSFFISGWETMQLTNNADFVIIEAGVGHGLTSEYDASYINGGASRSSLQIKSGFTDGGMADVFHIDADSSVYLSFDFADDSGNGVSAVFAADGDVTVDDIGSNSSANIDVNIDRTAGSGLTIDYFEGTANKDTVVNYGSKGITVNLGGSSGTRDEFTGSTTSANDMLDAREAHTLTFTEGAGNSINVSGVSEIGSAVHATLENVDYIMVRDDQLSGTLPTGATNEYIWSQVGTQDVDFYRDMSHLNNTFVIDSLGSGATDEYGKGYDVMTSAIVDTFGTGSDLRVYYEGDHDDFIDTDDIMYSSEGFLTMSSGDSSRGSTWEADIASSGEYGKGQAPGFYIEIINAQDSTDKDKLAVTFDDVKSMWKVDTTAVQVAEGVNFGAGEPITAATSSVDVGGTTITSTTSGADLAKAVADRFGIQLDMSAGVDHSATVISGDIYLNATEEAITQLLGSGVEDKSYNFGFYTKVDLKAVGGDVTVNVNLQQQAGGNTFKLDFTDLDVGVESFYNVVGDDASPVPGVISSSEAGEFVKIDNAQDIALGNGGNDTYVVGANASGIYGGTALEYGDIGTNGGLANSDADAVNFNSVDKVSDLIFERKAVRNEIDGNSLSIKDSVTGEETILFDNYNTYLDFRRVEYLTVEDGANNNEVYEIVTNTNLSDWDNEIYVADGGTSHVMVGGIDHMIGSDKADTVNLIFSDITGGAVDDLNNTIDLSGLTSADTVTIDADAAGDVIANQSDLETKLNAGIDSGTDGKATISYDYSANAVTVTYDNVDGTTYDFTETYALL